MRGIVLDVSDRKEASEAYRSLVENSLQGRLIIFQDSRAVLASQAASNIIGYSKEDLPILPSETCRRVRRVALRLRAQGCPAQAS